MRSASCCESRALFAVSTYTASHGARKVVAMRRAARTRRVECGLGPTETSNRSEVGQVRMTACSER